MSVPVSEEDLDLDYYAASLSKPTKQPIPVGMVPSQPPASQNDDKRTQQPQLATAAESKKNSDDDMLVTCFSFIFLGVIFVLAAYYMMPTASQQGREKAASIKGKLSVNLEDVMLENTLSIHIDRNVLCPEDHSNHFERCPTCRGQGFVLRTVTMGPGFQGQMKQQCHHCGGRGEFMRHKCGKCGGALLIKEQTEIPVTIPAGAPEGHLLILKDKGHESPFMSPGDVELELSSSRHLFFERNGSHLVTDINVSLFEALAGFRKNFDHLDGTSVEVYFEGVTSHGQVIKVEGKGLPVFNSVWKSRGDLFVRISVTFPDDLDEDEKQKVRKLLEI